MDKLLLIDGNSLINRAFYALPFFTNKMGEHTGAVFGFANMLLKAIESLQPQHIVVAFDVSRKTFRTEMYSDYKGTRKETPVELRSQFDLVKKMLDCMGIQRVELQGYEADDIIGTLAKQYKGLTYILTGDRDVLQLLDQKTKVMFTKKGISEIEEYTNFNLKEKYGVNPAQVVDLKALMGDKSDNIPGLSGVGPKTALTLIEQYNTIENIYNNLDNLSVKLKEKFQQNKDIVYLSKVLATIKTDCKISLDFDTAKLNMPFNDCLKDFFKDLEFDTLLKRKNLFKNEIMQNEIKEYIINNQEDLNILVDGIKQTKKLAFCLTNQISFAYDHTNFILPKQLDLFSSFITAEQCLTYLKPVFEDENIEKITFDLKSHFSILHANNIYININNIYDYSILRYLVWAGAKIKDEPISAGYILANLPTYKQKLKELELENLYFNIELPLTFVLYDMEQAGFKIDKKELNNFKTEIENKIEKLKTEIWELAGLEFNINSPKQVADVLFDKLQMKSYIDKKRSTNIDVLNDLVDKHPIVPLIIRHRKLYKLYSTYVIPYTEMVEKQGDIIRTVFNQTLTATGRLSSSEPNMQNIPVRDDEGKMIRKIFVSRFTDGVLMSADYNQIELRILADFSNDENLINCFKFGVDVHSKTASEIFNVDVQMVTSQMRRVAKAVNFGIVYGISDYGLATTLTLPKKQAKEYIAKYFDSYPNVKVFQDNQIQTAKQTGMVKTLFGRIRRVPEITSSNYVLRQFGERVSMNMPLQGSASDIIKSAMIKVDNKLKENNLKARLILQIHDELILDVPKEEIEICQNIIKQCMENVVNLQISLPVDINFSSNLYYNK